MAQKASGIHCEKKNTEEQNRISSDSSQRTLSLFYLTLWIIYSDDVKIL